MEATYAEHAWLYDAAFSWDLADEANWLRERFGSNARSALEPACGSGRVLLELARRGFEAAGVDASATMLARARRRFEDAGLAPPLLLEGDMAAFDLGRTFDAAVCPVGTFAYLLTEDDAARHLDAVARHLRPGGRYLVQLGLRDLEDFQPLAPGPNTRWDSPSARGTVRCTVFGRGFDAAARHETVVTRFEVLDGADAGLDVEAAGPQRAWDWASWRALIGRSPFRQAAAWDGNAPGRPAVPVDEALEGRLLAWHELHRD